MRITVTILIVLVWTLGLIQPGVWTHSFDLHKMYGQCSHEDPDIDPVDFVVEHLLNLEDVLDYLEGEEDEQEEGELPHQPYRTTQFASNYFVALPKTTPEFTTNNTEFFSKAIYPPNKNNCYCYKFNADVFRPPIA